jgi:hypothetical protein
MVFVDSDSAAGTRQMVKKQAVETNPRFISSPQIDGLITQMWRLG